jgi:hypothetical protein
METELEVLLGKIRAACTDTKPGTSQSEALSSIQWRLEAENGLCAGLDSRYSAALVHPANAMIFDGRDNPELKQQFYESVLGVNLAVVMLKH